MKKNPGKSPEKTSDKVTWKKDMRRNWQLYLIVLPVVIYFFIFCYLPMFGILMAWQDFKVVDGFFGSQWIGWENFRVLFTGSEFGIAFRNTCIMALFNLLIGFPAPVIFALFISSLRFKKFRRLVQTISYLPNFIAATVIVELMKQFAGQDGVLIPLFQALGFKESTLLTSPTPPIFWLTNCLTGIWQSFGYSSIIFVAAIFNINGDLFEAAAIDGASTWQRMWRITIPCLLPMIVMMFVMQVAISFRVGFDKIILLQTNRNFEVTDVLFTYTYRYAFGISPNQGLGAASGLFQSVLSTVLLVTSNWLSRKLTNYSLF